MEAVRAKIRGGRVVQRAPVTVPDLTPEQIAAQEMQQRVQLVRSVSAYATKVRSAFARPDAAQTQAYLRAETKARRILDGTATEAEIAYIQARDVDVGTINPRSGKAVANVVEASAVIVGMGDQWGAILDSTEAARKQAQAALGVMKFSDAPQDLEAWLSENFAWLPPGISLPD